MADMRSTCACAYIMYMTNHISCAKPTCTYVASRHMHGHAHDLSCRLILFFSKLNRRKIRDAHTMRVVLGRRAPVAWIRGMWPTFTCACEYMSTNQHMRNHARTCA